MKALQTTAFTHSACNTEQYSEKENTKGILNTKGKKTLVVF